MVQTIRSIVLVLAVALVAAASASANSGGVHPIVFSTTYGEPGFLLGGSAAGAWLDAGKAVAPKLKGGEVYRHYSLDGMRGKGKGPAPVPGSIHTSCSDGTLVALLRRPTKLTVSVAGGWNALPRIPRVQSKKQKTYREAVVAFLKSNGVAHPVADLDQVIRVDLEGDGVEEVLLSAYHRAPRSGNEQAGEVVPADHSFVLLRKLHKGKVKTVAVTPLMHASSGKGDAPYRAEIAAILDLNGDGAMEIVVFNEYYEGYSASVMTVKGPTVKEVLLEGCGD